MVVKLFIPGEEFMFGLCAGSVGCLSVSCVMSPDRFRVLPLQVVSCYGVCVFVLCQMGLVPPFTKTGWTLTPVLSGEAGAGHSGTSQGALCWRPGRKDVSDHVRWESFWLQSFYCNVFHTLLGPDLHVVELAFEGTW